MARHRSRLDCSSGSTTGAGSCAPGASYLLPISGQVGASSTAAPLARTHSTEATAAIQNHAVCETDAWSMPTSAKLARIES
jgi:hypothetical protein